MLGLFDVVILMEIAPILIYLVVPAIGLGAFACVLKTMRRRAIPEPPVISLFALFFLNGSLLLVVLTALFWHWSGLASLGAAFLVLVGPVMAVVLLVKGLRTSTISPFHQAVPIMSVAFMVALVVYCWISIV